MKTPDVNVLVAAFRADHPHHGVAQRWLVGALEEGRRGAAVGLLPMVAASFLRLVTHPRVFLQPSPTDLAVDFVDALLAVPGCQWLELASEWPHMAALCRDRALQANQIPDAWIAAAVRRHGAHLVTFDRDFSKWLDRHEFTWLRA